MSTAMEGTEVESVASTTLHVVDDQTTRSLAPSHIFADGRFIFLPQPTERERRLFFERSIARHGLLQEDLGQKKTSDEEEEKEEKEAKVHPLALASARIQANGINELNRAINLSGLVATGEYFGMSNIVDPSLEATNIAVTTKDTKKNDLQVAATEVSSSPTAVSAPLHPAKDAEEERVKSLYVLKRKRTQFLKASTVLGRHQRRLEAAIVAQAQPDARLRHLRQNGWRLVAPEHGTRALPHATRPSEIVACDVDVYLKHSSSSSAASAAGGGDDAVALGRLTSRVPRYATTELKENYTVEEDLKRWRQKFGRKEQDEDMDVDEEDRAEREDETKEKYEDRIWTVAEPFVIADPTLGKLDADFDPKAVKTLSLQFDIEKSSTGFRQSAVLQPITSSPSETAVTTEEDEEILFALQHSLFCAKLFESIRRELAPDTEDVGNITTTATPQSVVWLTQESDSNFLPPPSSMSGERIVGLAPLCVIHCHEGEVKVQLDCEYTLRVKLVEASDTKNIENTVTDGSCTDSGSQSPQQLLVLCRTLLFHAEERYHQHSKRAANSISNEAVAAATTTDKKKKDFHTRKREATSPRILQSCVSLGSKLLLEQRIRRTLTRIHQWLLQKTAAGANTNDQLQVEWLSLSVLDLHSQFTLVFRDWVADACLLGEQITVTSTNPQGEYRKVTFCSDSELELYLKLVLQRILRDQQLQQ